MTIVGKTNATVSGWTLSFPLTGPIVRGVIATGASSQLQVKEANNNVFPSIMTSDAIRCARAARMGISLAELERRDAYASRVVTIKKQYELPTFEDAEAFIQDMERFSREEEYQAQIDTQRWLERRHRDEAFADTPQ